MAVIYRQTLLGAASCLAFAVAALPASAQTAAESPRPAGEPAATSGEIIVTARKRAETLIEAPLAISALSGETLSEAQVTDLRALSRATPGFFFESQGAGRNDRSINNLTVRGMPSGGSQNATGERASVFIDGAPVFGGFVQGLTDLSRVEVLRGPQSAYFGRATFSGAINLITSAPSTTPTARVEASIGEDGYTDNQITAEGPLIGDILSGRVNVRYYEAEGQYDNAAEPGETLGDRSTQSLSGTVYFTPTSQFTAKLFATMWEDDDGPDARSRLNRNDFNCNANNGASNNWICGDLPQLPDSRFGMNTSFSQEFATEVIRNSNRRFVQAVDNDFKDDYGLGRQANHVSLVADYETPLGVTLTYVGAVDNNNYVVINDSDSEDSRGFPNSNFPARLGAKSYIDYALRADVSLYSHYHEGRITSDDDGRFTWLAGVSYFEGNRHGTVFGAANAGYAQFSNTQSDVKTTGVFGSISYDITDRLNASVEGRYQKDEVAQSANFGATLSETFNSFTPRVILSYDVMDDANLYVSYAKGVNPGGFNAALFSLSPSIQADIQAQFGAEKTVEEEEIDNYEIGFKTRLFDRRVTLATAAYYAEWTNQQLSTQAFYIVPGTGTTNGVSVVTNIGETELYGFEVEGSWLVTANLTLSGAIGINENELIRYDCIVCRSNITGVADVSGNKLARTPRFTSNFSIAWEDDLTGDWGYFARADYSYRGEMYVTEANLATVEPLQLVNLRAGVTRGPLRLEAFALNAFDEDGYVSAERSADLLRGGNAISVGLVEKRRIGARLAYTF